MRLTAVFDTVSSSFTMSRLTPDIRTRRLTLSMVLNRTTQSVPSRPPADENTARPAPHVDIQQMTRDVFADVKDITDFYNITFSRTRVSYLEHCMQELCSYKRWDS